MLTKAAEWDSCPTGLGLPRSFCEVKTSQDVLVLSSLGLEIH